jgi:hypothetical protein
MEKACPFRACAWHLPSGAAWATLAQLVERLIRNQQAAGSIPAGGSMFSITYSWAFSHSSYLSRTFVSKQRNFAKSEESAG